MHFTQSADFDLIPNPTGGQAKTAFQATPDGLPPLWLTIRVSRHHTQCHCNVLSEPTVPLP
jgi:hypothetical protein